MSTAGGSDEQLGIGLVGCGRAAQTWHLPVYAQRGLRVVGAFDVEPEALGAVLDDHPALRPFPSLDSLLEDPDVDVVDLATRPPGRIELLERILEAGKHVLVQKPVSEDLSGLRRLARRANELGLRVAVNVNGRWAPAWATTTSLLREGAIGTVQSVTHVYDTRVAWVPNPTLQGTDRFLLFDYTTHWIDITMHWVGQGSGAVVQARDRAVPVPPGEGRRMETMWVAIEFDDGAGAVIRGAAGGIGRWGHPFWIHGADGTIRGDVDSERGDWVELQTETERRSLDLAGSWFPDAFGGTMCELLESVREGREPTNSLRDHLRTLSAVCGACESARRGGIPVRLSFEDLCQ